MAEQNQQDVKQDKNQASKVGAPVDQKNPTDQKAPARSTDTQDDKSNDISGDAKKSESAPKVSGTPNRQ